MNDLLVLSMHTFRGLILLALVLVSCSVVFAQQSVTIFPEWKVGEKKTIYTIDKDIEFVGDSLVSDKINRESQYDIEVVAAKPMYLDLKVTYANDLIALAEEDTDDKISQLDPYRTIDMIYRVDKSNGAYELLNWKEIIAFANKMDTALIKHGSEKVASNIKAKRYSTKRSLLSSKKDIEDSFGEVLAPLTILFGSVFTENNTVEVIKYKEGLSDEKADNPRIPIYNYFRLNYMDDSTGICVIDLIIDYGKLLGNVKANLDQLLQTLDLQQPNVDMEGFTGYKGKITYNTHTTWPISMELYFYSPWSEINTEANTTSVGYYGYSIK